MEETSRLTRWMDCFFEEGVWGDLTPQKQAAAKVLRFDQEKWDYDDDDYDDY